MSKIDAMRVDTIYAPASGIGVAGISIIRISGPETFEIISAITRSKLPEPRRLVLRTFYGADDEPLDQGMLVVFQENASYTKERMAEIHCHGSRAVVNDICAFLDDHDGCRLADPGEFSRRAFMNGAMDLVDVEGVGDLLGSETSMQRRQAMRILEGGLHSKLEGWRAALLHARALVEVTIDWVDEEVPEDVFPEVREILSSLQKDLKDELHRSDKSERLRAGFSVAIIGPPNVGKSSLLNALVGREVAIVSNIPGTTRDLIEARLDLNGLPVHLVDTAGLRETDDTVEKIGVDRARDRAATADLRIWMKSIDTAGEDDLGSRCDGDLVVWSKSDLGHGTADIHVSAATGAGLDELLAMIERRLTGTTDEFGLLGHLRQREAVSGTVDLLALAIDEIDSVPIEVLAQTLTRASAVLERLTGRIGTEDMLDAVFSSFCLGK